MFRRFSATTLAGLVVLAGCASPAAPPPAAQPTTAPAAPAAAQPTAAPAKPTTAAAAAPAAAATTAPAPAAPAKPARPNELRLNAELDPDSMDPALMASRVPGEIANTLFDGLVRLDEKGEPTPGMAEKWTVSPDGLTYTFNLRKDAKWTDGHGVVAQDFVYSWQRELIAETAAPLVSNLFYIKNAEPFNSGKIKDFAEVGLKAKDDYTLETVMEAPTPFWVKLTAFFNMLPVHKDSVQASPKDWTRKPETYISNGPFKLEKWTPDQELSVVKNPDYWAKDQVKLDRIVWRMINDRNTAYQSLQAGELDVMTPAAAAASQLLKDGKAISMPASRLFFVRFNNQKAPFNNAKVRQAFSLAAERKPLVDQVLQGGQKPAFGMIPAGLSSGTGDFRTQAGDVFKEDPAQAKELLAAGLKEMGMSALPDFTIDYFVNDTFKKMGEVLQAQWKKNLGVDLKLNAIERKTFIDSMRKFDYTLGLYSTSADFDDAINLVTQFTTGDSYNFGQYSNPEYDAPIKQALKEPDPQKRTQQMISAEKALLSNMGLAPIFYDATIVVVQPYVKGIRWFAAATNDFSRVSVN
ncbi:MAG: peptide ABC transporter substrate-binding protein [Chloroflexi bacterium]|nr:peptide ABC transporter substrate-binding protein [Chloroflexota bacterium]